MPYLPLSGVERKETPRTRTAWCHGNAQTNTSETRGWTVTNTKFAGQNFKIIQLKTMPDPCWEWSHHRAGNGYGIIKIKGKNEYVHRLMYRLFVGHINNLQVIRHQCDNPPCGNPNHLRKGTPAENIADCKEKYRHSFGDKQPNARLDDKKVEEMRKEYSQGSISQPALAKQYGVCRSTVRA